MKKSTKVFLLLLSFLLWSFVYIVKYDPDRLPTFLTDYRAELLAKQSKESIDEMLVLYEKSKGMQGIDALTYLMTLTLDYGMWLDDNKIFIDQHPALKKAIIEQLKNAVPHIDIDFVHDFFEDHIKLLEDETGEKKSIVREFL